MKLCYFRLVYHNNNYIILKNLNLDTPFKASVASTTVQPTLWPTDMTSKMKDVVCSSSTQAKPTLTTRFPTMSYVSQGILRKVQIRWQNYRHASNRSWVQLTWKKIVWNTCISVQIYAKTQNWMFRWESLIIIILILILQILKFRNTTAGISVICNGSVNTVVIS